MQKYIHQHSLSVFSVEDIRQIESFCYQSGLDEWTLMSRAGQGAFDIFKKHRPLADFPVLHVYCTKGNNGGDGFVLAGLAAEKGYDVTVIEIGNFEGQSDVSKQAKSFAIRKGCKFESSFPKTSCDSAVDALFGIGFSGSLSGVFSQAVSQINEAPWCLALDIPSGVDANTGFVSGDAVKAQVTVTFIGTKWGLFHEEAPRYIGDVYCDDLEIPQDIFQICSPLALTTPKVLLEDLLPKRPLNSHKGLFGHVLVVGGYSGMSGAAILAAESAYRLGAGKVTVATHKDTLSPLLTRLPEAMTVDVSAGQLPLDIFNDKTVIAIGPGLGRTEWGLSLLNACIASNLPLVIDADALYLMSTSNTSIPAYTSVLTPHPGEAAMLLKCSSADIQKARLKAVNHLQDQTNQFCVLKGQSTLISQQDHTPRLCSYGTPNMAKAGMGDVLTGIIAGLIAQGLPLSEAAYKGVLLHAVFNDDRNQLPSEIISLSRLPNL